MLINDDTNEQLTNMPKIKYLRVRFDQNIFPSDIPRFRAAVIEKTQRKARLFHNHIGEDKFDYRYPLIQYKVTNKKASMVCLEDGTNEIHELFMQKDLTLRVGNSTEQYKVEDLYLNHFLVQTWQSTFDYSLLNWMPLNQENYKKFKELEDNLPEQVKILERTLLGHILAFATGIGWKVEEKIIADIYDIKEMNLLPFKGQKMLAISLSFRSNISFPDFIGLGKGGSIGFGVVKRLADLITNRVQREHDIYRK